MHRTSLFVADRTYDVNKHVCRNNSNNIVLDVELNILQSCYCIVLFVEVRHVKLQLISEIV